MFILILFARSPRGVTGVRLGVCIQLGIAEHLLMSGPVLSAGVTAVSHLVLTHGQTDRIDFEQAITRVLSVGGEAQKAGSNDRARASIS